MILDFKGEILSKLARDPNIETTAHGYPDKYDVGAKFLRKWDQIKNQGFDLSFKRMWEFYLSYCEAGFKSKNIDLIQFSMQNK